MLASLCDQCANGSNIEELGIGAGTVFKATAYRDTDLTQPILLVIDLQGERNRWLDHEMVMKFKTKWS